MKPLLFAILLALLIPSLKNVDIQERQDDYFLATARREPTREEVLVANFKEEKPLIDDLWGVRESGYNPEAVNPTSGACGVPQALPCGKMGCNLSQDIHDFICQVKWGANYIYGRYGSVQNALAYHDANNSY